MLFNVFVAFLGLNNNTILAMQNVEFGSVSSDRYPIRRKCQYRSDNDPEYRIGATLVTCLDQRFCPFKTICLTWKIYILVLFWQKVYIKCNLFWSKMSTIQTYSDIENVCFALLCFFVLFHSVLFWFISVIYFWSYKGSLCWYPLTRTLRAKAVKIVFFVWTIPVSSVRFRGDWVRFER